MTSEPSTSSSHLCHRRVALLCCGDFNPPNIFHMRLFERTRDYLEKTMSCQVVEGIMCPSSDSNSNGVIEAKHRLRMVDMAVRRSYWIRAGDYNIKQTETVRQLDITKHYQKEMKRKHGSDVVLLYLCGSDVLESFNRKETNNLWTQEELSDLLTNYGLIVMKRGKHHPNNIIYLMDVLRKNQKNIFILEDETFPSDVSSSRIRRAIRRGESVKYCIDDGILEYIEEQKLYFHQTNPIGISDVTTSSVNSSATTSTSSMRAVIQTSVTETSQSSSWNQKLDQSTTTDSTAEITSPIWKTPPSSKESSSEPIGKGTLQPTPKTSFDVTVLEECLKSKPTDEKKSSVVVQDESTSTSTVSATTTITTGAVFRPILSQRQLYEVMTNPPLPAMDSPLPKLVQQQVISKASKLPLPPGHGESRSSEVMKSLPPLDVHINLNNYPSPMASPNYDNVTLDDLLLASTSWAEYLSEQSQKLQAENRLKSKEISPTHSVSISGRMTPPAISSKSVIPNSGEVKKRVQMIVKQPSPVKNREREKKIKEEKSKERKKSWFFNRPKSLKEMPSIQSPTSDDEALIRICGTDRRRQQQTSPEILWRKVKDFGISKERWSEIAGYDASRKISANAELVHTDRSPKKTKDNRNLRFAQQMTKSAEDLNRLACYNDYFRDNHFFADDKAFSENISKSYYSGMSEECRNGSPRSGVTLTFRRYRLTATPETTV